MSPPPARRSPPAALTFLAGFVLAFVLLAGAGVLFMGTHMGDGSMMGSGGMDGMGGMGSGWLSTAAVVLLVAIGLVALLLTSRGWLQARRPPAPGVQPPPVPGGPLAPPPPPAAAPGPPPTPLPQQEAEALALRLLDADERLLFMEVRDAGGSALQKDLGHRDGFSRTKVTRVLDRLEEKGLVVREREGMTNRVRLLTRRSGGA